MVLLFGNGRSCESVVVAVVVEVPVSFVRVIEFVVF